MLSLSRVRLMTRFETLFVGMTFVLLWSAWLHAGPVLVCDAYSVNQLQPTKFVVVIDGVSRDVLPERFPDGTSRLRHDLGEIADGTHTVKVKAVNSVVSPGSLLESAEIVISFGKKGSQILSIKNESDKRIPTRDFRGYLKEEH
jgi:hypothetical protein